jgi:hypothetical protein
VVTPQKAIPISALQNPFAKTFYPSAVDGRDARPVLVREGEEVAAVDIGLRGGVATISGRIVTPTGQPIPRTASFYLSPVDSTILTDSLLPSVQNSARNRTDGQFEIQGVLPGDYDLIATSSSSNNVPALWGRTRINVVSSGASDITVKLLAGIDVKVRMTVDGGPPPFTAAASILRPSIALNLRSVEPYGRSSEGMVNPNSKFDATGVYVFPGVPELRYYVQPASLPPNAYIADVQVGETSVYDNGFDVGNISGTIEMKVLTNGGRIQGSVLDAAKKPVGYAVVALVPEQSRRQNTSLYKVLISDLQGSFTITGIAPGEYKLFAWEAVSRDAPLNPEFIAKFESLGQRVTIAAAESSKVDLNLIPKS